MSEPSSVKNGDSAVEFQAAVLQKIRRHARSSMEAEICGILIGATSNGVTHVQACIPGENATEGGTHVTFTQETWQHIYKVKDADFPDSSIVGWYHSHPGFGIFLSDYDLFIHKNFFSAEHQVAWVFDPHSDDEGCFGWVDGEIAPLSSFSIRREMVNDLRPPAVSGLDDDPEMEIFSSSPAKGRKWRRAVTRTNLAVVIATALLIIAFFAWWQSPNRRASMKRVQPSQSINAALREHRASENEGGGLSPHQSTVDPKKPNRTQQPP